MFTASPIIVNSILFDEPMSPTTAFPWFRAMPISKCDQHWRLKFAVPGGTAKRFLRLNIAQ